MRDRGGADREPLLKRVRRPDVRHEVEPARAKPRILLESEHEPRRGTDRGRAEGQLHGEGDEKQDDLHTEESHRE